jgi:hypothetical protein
MKISRLLFFLVLILGVSTAWADWINEPVKWSQGPDLQESDDLFSMHALPAPWDLVVHDDWECTDPHPVIAARWWGSYLVDETAGEYSGGERGNRHVPFELSFHYDVPAGMDDPTTPEVDPLTYSHPAQPLQFNYVYAQEEYAFTDAAGKDVYVYNAYLDMPFDQEYWKYHPENPVQGSPIFWFNVALDPFAPEWAIDAAADPGSVVTWGWSKAEEGWMDMAIQNEGWHWPPWNDPPGAYGPGSPGDSLHYDRAFELMVPEPMTLVLLDWEVWL